MKRTAFSCITVAILLSNLWAQPAVEPVSRLNYWGTLEHIAVAGDFVFASNTWGLLVFDVGNPAETVMMDSIPILGSISSLVIQEDILYVGAKSFPRFDVSNPRNLRRLPDIDGFTLISVRVGDYAYSYGYERLFVADISDPEEPVIVDTLRTDFYTTKMIAKDDVLLCLSERYERVFQLISIQNPDQPELIGEFQNDLFRERETLGTPIQLVGDQLYLTTYAAGDQYLSCIDFSDPAEPYLRWDRQVDGWWLDGGFEDVLVIGTYHDEGHDVILYSTEDPDTLVELGRLNDRISFELIMSENILYSINSDGMDIYNAEDYDNIESIGGYRTYALGNFAKVGDYLYSSANDNTIRVISVENIHDPHEVAQVEFDDWRQIREEWDDDDGNKYLITVTDPLTLKIIQVDGEQLTSVGEIDIMPEGLEDYQREYPVVDVWEGGIVVGTTFYNREDRLRISQFLVVSLEHVDRPEVIGRYLWDEDYYSDGFSFPHQILVNGDYIYIPFERFGNEESFIISIEDPTQPEVVEFDGINGLAYPLAIEGNLLISNLEIYNIDDPLHPTIITELGNWYDRIRSISIQDGLMVLGGWSWSPEFVNFRFYNVRDPEHPILITEMELPESVNHVILDEGVVYAQGYSGIEIMQYTGADGVADGSVVLPAELELSEPFPNPFNSTTQIRYSIQQPSNVELTIYDTAGRVVKSLMEGWQSAGSHQRTVHGDNLSAGVYLLRLEAKDLVRTQKVLLLK